MADRGDLNLGIHGARGLFCMFVVIYHVWNSGLPRPDVPEVVESAFASLKFGVELFFAISGFVIFITMRRSRTPLGFIANRATRILPVLWVTLFVFLPMGAIDGGRVTEHFEPLWLFLLKLAGNMLALGPILPVPVFFGVAWTIGYEFAFYVLCFLHLLVLRHTGRNLGWLFILLGLALVAGHPRALFFISGMLVAAGWLDAPAWRRMATAPGIWLIAFLGLWQWAAAAGSPFFPPMWDWSADRLLPLAAVAFAAMTLLIAGISQGQGLLTRYVLTTPVMLWLGTISYSLYLWHTIVLGVVKFAMRKLGLGAVAGEATVLLLLAIAVPLALAISHLSQKLIEERLTNWLRARIRTMGAVPART